MPCKRRFPLTRTSIVQNIPLSRSYPFVLPTKGSRPGKLAGKRRSFSSSGGGILARMFGGSGGSVEAAPPSPKNATSSAPPSDTAGGAQTVPSALNATTNQSEQPRQRRKPSKAAQLIASAKQSLSSSSNNGNNNEKGSKSNHKDDPDEPSPGANNNAAGDSKPSPRSTFRVGVTEDKNKKCRRTMEDTHSYLYNFLPPQQADSLVDTSPTISDESNEWDNGYFAIFDGHAGTFAADWCGKKLHVILEENIRKHPNTPIPELLDMTFTNCDGQLEKLPVKNSGCTAVCAVLRWEQRLVQNTAISESGAGKSTVILSTNNENAKPNEAPPVQIERKRVLYTANVGDARIVLCRGGKALRLSYDHKGSDENEGRRVANAGGLILNNRVNGMSLHIPEP